MTADWSWLGRPLAVDFANTVEAEAPRGAVDHLRDSGGLASWLAAEGHRLPPVEDGAMSERLADFQSLRDDVRVLLRAAVDGVPYPDRAIASVNAAAAAAMTAPRLESVGDGLVVTEHSAADRPSTAVLGVLARSTIFELGDGRRESLRRCGAPACGAFYVAGRPRQQWCSDACGNRARVARHASKRSSTT